MNEKLNDARRDFLKAAAALPNVAATTVESSNWWFI